MTKTMKALEVGETIAYSPRSGIMITLQRVRAGVFHVLTMAGPRRLDDWSRSYGTEIEARSAARHVALLLRDWGCEAAIYAARKGVEARRYDALLHDRASWAKRVLPETEAQLDAMMTLA